MVSAEFGGHPPMWVGSSQFVKVFCEMRKVGPFHLLGLRGCPERAGGWQASRLHPALVVISLVLLSVEGGTVKGRCSVNGSS